MSRAPRYSTLTHVRLLRFTRDEVTAAGMLRRIMRRACINGFAFGVLVGAVLGATAYWFGELMRQ